MGDNNRHIIRQVSFDIRKSGQEGALDLQEWLSGLFWRDIAPALEALFDDWAGPEELIRLDRLELDLGAFKASDLNEELKARLVSALRDLLEKQIRYSNKPLSRKPVAEGHFDRWLFFLENGYYPWSGVADHHDTAFIRAILSQIAGQESALKKLKDLLERNPAVYQRIIWTHPGSFLRQLIEAITGTGHASTPDLLRIWEAVLPEIARRKAGRLRPLAAREIKAGRIAQLFWTQVLVLTIHFGKKATPAYLGASLLQLWTENPAALLEAIVDTMRKKRSQKLPLETLALIHPGLPDMINQGAAPSPAGSPAEPAANAGGAKEGEPLEEEKTGPAISAKQEDADQTGDAPEGKKPEKEKAGRKKQGKQIETQETDFEGVAKKTPDFGEKTTGDSPFNAPDAIPAFDPKKWVESLPPPYGAAKTLPLEVGEGELIYQQGAGVVLLHPFLPAFFKELGLMEDKAFRDEEAQRKGVRLLHFLTFGAEAPPEHQMAVAKILCGSPVHMPADPAMQLTRREEEEADNLLRAVIGHWKALGRTSPDGLRQGFLQREGRLEKQASGWKLFVNRKTEDILVDRMPWGIGMIKLSWMEEVLKVEW